MLNTVINVYKHLTALMPCSIDPKTQKSHSLRCRKVLFGLNPEITKSELQRPFFGPFLGSLFGLFFRNRRINPRFCINLFPKIRVLLGGDRLILWFLGFGFSEIAKPKKNDFSWFEPICGVEFTLCFCVEAQNQYIQYQKSLCQTPNSSQKLTILFLKKD